MRDFSFRIWDKTCGGWLENFVIYQYGNVSSNGVWLGWSEIDLMQYSGLKDASGTKIFEGDILENGDTALEGEVIHVCEFQDGAFRFEPYIRGDQDSPLGGYEEFSHQLEELGHALVIGNVWENKELLNENCT